MSQLPKRNAVIEAEKRGSKRNSEVDKSKVKKGRKDSAMNRYLIKIAQKPLNENILRSDTSILAQSDLIITMCLPPMILLRQKLVRKLFEKMNMKMFVKT